MIYARVLIHKFQTPVGVLPIGVQMTFCDWDYISIYDNISYYISYIMIIYHITTPNFLSILPWFSIYRGQPNSI